MFVDVNALVFMYICVNGLMSVPVSLFGCAYVHEYVSVCVGMCACVRVCEHGMYVYVEVYA